MVELSNIAINKETRKLINQGYDCETTAMKVGVPVFRVKRFMIRISQLQKAIDAVEGKPSIRKTTKILGWHFNNTRHWMIATGLYPLFLKRRMEEHYKEMRREYIHIMDEMEKPSIKGFARLLGMSKGGTKYWLNESDLRRDLELRRKRMHQRILNMYAMMML